MEYLISLLTTLALHLPSMTGQPVPTDATSLKLLDEAIGYYQSASSAYRHGDLKLVRR